MIEKMGYKSNFDIAYSDGSGNFAYEIRNRVRSISKSIKVFHRKRLPSNDGSLLLKYSEFDLWKIFVVDSKKNK